MGQLIDWARSLASDAIDHIHICDWHDPGNRLADASLVLPRAQLNSDFRFSFVMPPRSISCWDSQIDG